MIKAAPFSFAAVAFIAFGGAYWMSSMRYSGEIAGLSEQVKAKDGQLARYRVALGIDPASKGALIELSHEELRAKAINTAAKLREMFARWEKRISQIQSDVDAGKIGKDEGFKRKMSISAEVGRIYNRDLKSDFLNVNNELLRRLDRKAAAAVVRGPIFAEAETGTPLGISSLVGDDMVPGFLSTYADQIEQLAKLLPVK